MRSRLAALRRTGDAGFTLAELMVTMVLLGIVTTMVLAATVTVGRTMTRNAANGDSLDIARIGMNRMSKNIRAGTEVITATSTTTPAFAEIGPETLTVYASLEGGTRKIKYSVNSQRELIETVWLPDANSAPRYTYLTSTPTSVVIARKIPAGSPAMFTPLDSNGAAVTPLPITDATILRTVRRVSIKLTVNANPGSGVPDSVLVNTVVLPNLGVITR